MFLEGGKGCMLSARTPSGGRLLVGSCGEGETEKEIHFYVGEKEVHTKQWFTHTHRGRGSHEGRKRASASFCAIGGA